MPVGMPNVSGITGMLLNWLINPALWLFVIIGFIIAIVFILYLRKRRTLKFKCLEIVDHGGGKVSFNNLRCGFFGKKLYFKGLWWQGEEVLRTSSGEIIDQFSTEDFQEIDGKRGIICFRDPLNQDILVPIHKAKILNKNLIAEIAPASFRDAAVDIFKETVRETTEWRDKLIQFGGWALVVVFSLVAIIVIVQMVKAGQTEAKDLILQAGKDGAQACKDICREAVNIAVSKVAP